VDFFFGFPGRFGIVGFDEAVQAVGLYPFVQRSWRTAANPGNAGFAYVCSNVGLMSGEILPERTSLVGQQLYRCPTQLPGSL